MFSTPKTNQTLGIQTNLEAINRNHKLVLPKKTCNSSITRWRETQGDCNLPVAPGDIDPCCHEVPVRPRVGQLDGRIGSFKVGRGGKGRKDSPPLAYLLWMVAFWWSCHDSVIDSTLDSSCRSRYSVMVVTLWLAWCGVEAVAIWLQGWEICLLIGMTKVCYFCSCVDYAAGYHLGFS